MKVGDYVRTKKGIAKIEGQNDDVRFAYPCAWITDTYLEINDDTEYVYDEDIIKSSLNIIDLIEVGDYVNGLKVDEIDEKGIYNYNSYDGWRVNIASCNKEIKSIVTFEQFSQMEYRIGE